MAVSKTVKVTFFDEPVNGKLGVYPDYYNGSHYYGRVQFRSKPGTDMEFLQSIARV